MRDARAKQERQEQEQEEPTGGKQPKGGKEQTRDPEDRTDGERTPEAQEAADEREDKAKSWATRLPPELRDRLSGQDWEKLPPRYKKLIENYLKRLLEQSAPVGR